MRTLAACSHPTKSDEPQLNANTRKLHDLGQRIWLDNITREMLNNGTLARYITKLSVTDHGKVSATLPVDGGYAQAVLDEFKREGVDDQALAARLQREGVQAFARSWSGLMARIQKKSSQPAAAAAAERAGAA